MSAGTWPGRGDPVPWEREIDEVQCGDNWKDARMGDLGTSPRTLGSRDGSVLRPGLSHLYLVTEFQALALTTGPWGASQECWGFFVSFFPLAFLGFCFFFEGGT